MVHLEVTRKENRTLCITNKDKHTEALGNLDKRFIHTCQKLDTFSFLNHAVARTSPSVTEEF